MWCAVFGDGLEVPDGICRQQNRPVVGRLNQRPMLPRRMSWKGEHHDASVAKDIPALAELGMVDGLAGLEGVAGFQPIVWHQIVKKSLGKASPTRQSGKFMHARGGGPALAGRFVVDVKTVEVVDLQMVQKEIQMVKSL